MEKKKIVLFSPYGLWTVHLQADAVLSAALRMRGAEVSVIVCDCALKNCLIARKMAFKDNPYSKSACRACYEFSMKYFSKFKSPVTKLSDLLSDEARTTSQTWIDGLSKEDLPLARYREYELGKWVHASLCAFDMSGKPNLEHPDVEEMSRSLLYNGALILHAHNKMISQFMPDHIILYNGKHAYYRVFYELSRKLGIPVLAHERGRIDDSFEFRVNEIGHFSCGRVEALQPWLSVPLTGDDCATVKRYLGDRQVNKNVSMGGYYLFKHGRKDIRKILRIPSDAPIVACYTGSDWEFGRDKYDIPRRFGASSITAIERLIKAVEGEAYYLVIRHHPFMVARTHTSAAFLTDVFELNRNLPENVRVIMPEEKIKSYDIAWNSDAAVSFGSTMGVESNLQGTSSASNVDNILTLLRLVDRIDSDNDYGNVIEACLTKTENIDVKMLQDMYRKFYFYMFRLSFQFKSFGIKNFWSPDIRVQGTQDLTPGKDGELDNLCKYILEGKALFPVPGEMEKNRSEVQEKEFFAKELMEIQKKRAGVRRQARESDLTPTHIPLVTVIPIRRNGRIISDNSVLKKSLKQSRHSKIEQIEIPFPKRGDIKSFLLELEIAVMKSQGEYLYFSADFVHLDEALISSAVDYLQENENRQVGAVVTGGWICDTDGHLNNEIFTERVDQGTYEVLNESFPVSDDPVLLLSLFVWRKKEFSRLINRIGQECAEPEDFSYLLSRCLFSDDAAPRVEKLMLPLVTIYLQFTEKELMEKGLREFEGGRYEEALAHFDRCLDAGRYDLDLSYHRAVCMLRLGREWEGGALIDMALASHHGNTRFLELKEQAMQDTGSRSVTYEAVSAAVERVPGYLVPGQERYLFEKVAALPDHARILEIGSYYGRSTSAMAFACMGSHKHIYAMDSFVGNRKGGGTRTIGNSYFDVWERNIRGLGLKQYITPLKGFSYDLIPRWDSERKFDFVFIDGSHHYEDVKKDFHLILPFVKENGWIALHDVTPAFPGVWRLWREEALPMLSSCEVCSTLACGRKCADAVPIGKNDAPPFKYCKSFIDFLREYFPDAGHLAEAYELSVKNLESTLPEQFLEAEKTIAKTPDNIGNLIESALSLEARDDGYLNFWYALILSGRQLVEKAQQYLNRGLSVSAPGPADRIELYLKQNSTLKSVS